MTPGSSVRHVSAVRHITKCATWPGDDPDEMPHNHSIYTMDHPDFIVCSFMENSIGLKLVDY